MPDICRENHEITVIAHNLNSVNMVRKQNITKYLPSLKILHRPPPPPPPPKQKFTTSLPAHPVGLIESYDDDYYCLSTPVSIVLSLFFINFIVTYFYSFFLFLENLFLSTDTHKKQETPYKKREISDVDFQFNGNFYIGSCEN